MDHSPLSHGPLFLGPSAENADLVERIIVEAFRDHVFWRRNFHPEDGPYIQEVEKRSAAFDTTLATLRQELYRLLSRLKHGAPFFSPRYIGHMTSEVMIGSLVGYFAAMLYNPNNISEEGAPVTMELELEVGEQLARLVGYGPAAWGHLCSGGSVANLEALWAVRALKYFAPAAALALRERGLSGPHVDGRPLAEWTPWQLMNLPRQASLDLREILFSDPAHGAALQRDLDALSLGELGYLGFHRRFAEAFGEELPEPVLLVPATKHYSWVKIANLLGLGQSQLIELPLDANYRIDPRGFADTLARLRRSGTPVLALVAVLGSTETGSVDALDRLLDATEAAAADGLTVYCHVDGAYGGYATAMFRDPEGRWVSSSPCGREVAQSFQALPRTDSITIDPHKLGYALYPAGAIVFADRRLRELLTTDAPYVFHQDDEHAAPTALGHYIVEGSKPGAAAAAIWLTHRTTPLNTRGFGAVIGSTVESAVALHAALSRYRSSDGFRFIPLNEPDLNLVTFLAVPPGVRSLEELNRFNEALYRRFAMDPERVVFTHEFLLSKTRFDLKKYRAGLDARLGSEFGSLLPESGALTVLRSTIMNPFIREAIRSDDYLGRLFASLERELRVVERELAGQPMSERARGVAP